MQKLPTDIIKYLIIPLAFGNKYQMQVILMKNRIIKLLKTYCSVMNIIEEGIDNDYEIELYGKDPYDNFKILIKMSLPEGKIKFTKFKTSEYGSFYDIIEGEGYNSLYDAIIYQYQRQGINVARTYLPTLYCSKCNKKIHIRTRHGWKYGLIYGDRCNDRPECKDKAACQKRSEKSKPKRYEEKTEEKTEKELKEEIKRYIPHSKCLCCFCNNAATMCLPFNKNKYEKSPIKVLSIKTRFPIRINKRIIQWDPYRYYYYGIQKNYMMVCNEHSELNFFCKGELIGNRFGIDYYAKEDLNDKQREKQKIYKSRKCKTKTEIKNEIRNEISDDVEDFIFDIENTF